MRTSNANYPLLTLRQAVFACFINTTVATMIILLATTMHVHASELQHQLNQIESGTLVVSHQDEDGSYQAISPLSTDVKIDVSGLLARAQVKQTFRNQSDHWIEAIYAFPLPDESRVDHMEMQIGDRKVTGEIRAKQQARKEYQQALGEGKRVSLLESQRANLFTNRVANIPPLETIEIIFSYQWQVEYIDGVFELRVPLTITPRYLPGTRLRAAERASVTANNRRSTQDGNQAQFVQSITDYGPRTDQVFFSEAEDISPPMTSSQNATPTSIFITINTAIALESVSSPSHDIYNDQTDTHWRVSLANAMVPADRDFTLNWSPQLGQSPLAAIFTKTAEQTTSTPGKPEHFASVMVVPPQDLFQSASTTREVIFVIDTSGSMQGNSIRQARAALQFAIERLTETDTFNVIEFDSVTQTLFTNARSASESNKTTAINWVRSLRADGGTEITAALDAALGNQRGQTTEPTRLRQVVFITDGSVGNEAELFKQIENTLGQSRLFTIGIGSAPNTWFMRRAAETGRGTYTYIARQEEVREQMRALLQKLEKPVLTEITLEWNNIDQPEVYPAVIPDLYAGEPILFDARWIGEPGKGSLSIQGRHAGNKWTNQLQIDTHATSTDISHTTSLEKQWAHRKIEAMENSLLFAEDRQSIEQQITDLALHYAMVTRYTSLIAVDQQVAREPAANALKRTAIPSAMPHGNTMLLPQGSLGIGLKLLLATIFSIGAILFGLATLRQVQTA